MFYWSFVTDHRYRIEGALSIKGYQFIILMIVYNVLIELRSLYGTDNISVISWWRKPKYPEKPPNCHKLLTNFIT